MAQERRDGGSHGGLHFKQVGREAMEERLIEYIIQDIVERDIAVPPGNRWEFAFSAVTADGRIAGCINGHCIWNEMHVHLLSVNPECAVRGTGTALIQHVERLACSSECDRMWLDTYTWQAKPFYEKLGFRQFAMQKNLPAGHTKFLLEKLWPLGEEAVLPPLPEPAGELSIVPMDLKAADGYLNEWLEMHTQRAVDDVEPYVRVDEALEVTLADGTLAAGCVYEIVWNEMHISLFCTSPELKKSGIGSAVLEKMTEIAKARGCCRITLDTMSWQARPFYEKNGFRHFGTQENIPHGHSRYYMEKVW